jgi:hypothetical protein
MNTMYDVQSILSFVLQSFTIFSLFYFLLMFVSQYPAYRRREKQAKTLQLNNSSESASLEVDENLPEAMVTTVPVSPAEHCGLELLTWTAEPLVSVAQTNQCWWAMELATYSNNNGAIAPVPVADAAAAFKSMIERSTSQLALPAASLEATAEPQPQSTARKSKTAKPAQTKKKEGKKQEPKKREKQSSVVLMGKDVQLYQLRGQQVVMVEDLPFPISETVKTYKLRGKPAIYFLTAQEIANQNDAAKEVKKAA